MPSASIAASSSGANEIVAAPGAGRTIRVMGYVLVARGAVTAKWVGGSTDKSGAILMAANTMVVVAPLATQYPTTAGWFETGDNATLNLTLNTTVEVDGHVTYEVVPA